MASPWSWMTRFNSIWLLYCFLGCSTGAASSWLQGSSSSGRAQPPPCAFIQTILHPSVSKDVTVLDSVKVLLKSRWTISSATSTFLIEGCQGLFPPFIINAEHSQSPSVLSMLGNGFWEHLLHCLPWDQREADWSVTLRSSFWSSLKICVTLALLQSSEASPNSSDLSMIVEIPASSPMSTSHQFPWACVHPASLNTP